GVTRRQRCRTPARELRVRTPELKSSRELVTRILHCLTSGQTPVLTRGRRRSRRRRSRGCGCPPLPWLARTGCRRGLRRCCGGDRRGLRDCRRRRWRGLSDNWGPFGGRNGDGGREEHG